jgi:hypothetical protein
VSRLCATKLYSTLGLISFLGNQGKISKLALEDYLFRFRTDCAVGISGAISPNSLIRIGPSTCPNRRYLKDHNFGSQIFVIKGRLSLWICTKRLCCPGLWEYLPGWVDLVGKHPSPESFACWYFGLWVVWNLVHFVSWLVTGFMIFSWSSWWTYPESLLFNVNFLRKQQTPKSTCKCELVTSLVCLVTG